jgi:hypothetical protein
LFVAFLRIADDGSPLYQELFFLLDEQRKAGKSPLFDRSALMSRGDRQALAEKYGRMVEVLRLEDSLRQGKDALTKIVAVLRERGIKIEPSDDPKETVRRIAGRFQESRLSVLESVTTEEPNVHVAAVNLYDDKHMPRDRVAEVLAELDLSGVVIAPAPAAAGKPGPVQSGEGEKVTGGYGGLGDTTPQADKGVLLAEIQYAISDLQHPNRDVRAAAVGAMEYIIRNNMQLVAEDADIQNAMKGIPGDVYGLLGGDDHARSGARVRLIDSKVNSSVERVRLQVPVDLRPTATVQLSTDEAKKLMLGLLPDGKTGEVGIINEPGGISDTPHVSIVNYRGKLLFVPAPGSSLFPEKAPRPVFPNAMPVIVSESGDILLANPRVVKTEGMRFASASEFLSSAPAAAGQPRNADGTFAEEPGKSPEYAWELFKTSKYLQDLLASQGYVTISHYALAYNGHNSGALRDISRSTVMRDLFTSQGSLVNQGLLAATRVGREYRFTLTEEGWGELRPYIDNSGVRRAIDRRMSVRASQAAPAAAENRDFTALLQQARAASGTTGLVLSSRQISALLEAAYAIREAEGQQYDDLCVVAAAVEGQNWDNVVLPAVKTMHITGAPNGAAREILRTRLVIARAGGRLAPAAAGKDGQKGPPATGYSAGGVEGRYEPPEVAAAKASAPVNAGGIDLRSMNIIAQPMGSFVGLDFRLPLVKNAERIDLDKEFAQIRLMVERGISPSGQRIKEFIAACWQRQEWDKRLQDVMACLVDVCRLEEDNLSETSAQLRECLVIVDSAA